MSDWSDNTPYSPPGAIEPPGAWARIGAGTMDAIDPLRLAWYWAMRQPEKAAAYRQQREADNAAYLAGAYHDTPAQQRPYQPDLWRSLPAFLFPLGSMSPVAPRDMGAADPARDRIASGLLGVKLPPNGRGQPLAQHIAADPQAWIALQNWLRQYGWWSQ